jgi:glycosyltransferase involved in cell wall biosynthesis
VSDKPVISIVLPTFNGSRYVGEAIRSCLDQTYRDWELIVVDDGSSDDTPAIIARYVEQDPRIRTFRHHTNMKLPAALNTGFGEARGDYFTWTSDDNVYLQSALSEMLRVLSESADTDIVYADVGHVDENGLAIRDVPAGPPEDLPFRNSVGACFLFRRRVFEELKGYRQELFMAEDYDFWLRASGRFRLLPLHRLLYRYRWHSRSLTSQQSAQARAIVAALERNLPEMHSLSSGQRAHAYFELAARCRRIRDGHRARRNLLRALRLRPSMLFTTRPTLLLGLTCGITLRSLLRGRLAEAQGSHR